MSIDGQNGTNGQNDTNQKEPEMTTKTASQTLRPIQHQRMIERLSAKINPATDNANTLRRIQWHTEQYLEKTGRLPE